ncbi:MAG: glutathione S-transferase family protein [Burkholderiaceae bacterium]|nr:glutathione S-transferase family protein [Burkholderiaceae bacterium]
MLKLHYHPLSTYTRRVRIALIEKGIEHETVLVDMARRAHREPDYLAINPYGRVPVLQDDDLLLYESNAILGYLEARHPSPALVPADAKGRALVDMHLRLSDIQMARQTGVIVFPKRFLPQSKWNPEAMAAAKAEIEKHLAVLEQQLGDRRWMVGDEYSLVEVSYTPFMQFLPLMEIVAPPRVAAWAERMLARPSALETAPAN